MKEYRYINNACTGWEKVALTYDELERLYRTHTDKINSMLQEGGHAPEYGPLETVSAWDVWKSSPVCTKRGSKPVELDDEEYYDTLPLVFDKVVVCNNCKRTVENYRTAPHCNHCGYRKFHTIKSVTIKDKDSKAEGSVDTDFINEGINIWNKHHSNNQIQPVIDAGIDIMTLGAASFALGFWD
jgi:DNA-directed RNA polymerase subunit RPC12/RpoP